MYINASGQAVDDGSFVTLNGKGPSGGVGVHLQGVHMDMGLRRPYWERGRRLVTLNAGWRYDREKQEHVPVFKQASVDELEARGVRSPVFNAVALPKDAWIQFDRAVKEATRPRLTAWRDLRASATKGGFNAMGKLTYEYQAGSDPGEAVQDMDGTAPGRDDQQLLNLMSTPLPITHSDFKITRRQLEVSREGGLPLRSTGPFPHTGTSTIYGYTNFPYRITKTNLHVPNGTNPDQVMGDVLDMVELMVANGYYGPYRLYHSTGYSRFFNDDYFRTGSTSAVRSLRERTMEVENLQSISRLDYLTSGYQLLLVQVDGDTVAAAIDGLDFTTVQWEERGGMDLRFMVMAIQVPLLFTPYNGIAGLVHGTTS